MTTQLIYGNWIRKRILLILGASALGAALFAFLPLGPLVRGFGLVLAGVLFVSFLIPFYSYLMFSPSGGGFQQKVYNLIIQSLGQGLRGQVLDIGSGNGVLAVKLAQSQPEVEVTGLDYWGTEWEYSKGVCDHNARIAQVDARVHFQKGDAAALDFPDGAFDATVSNLTFHEVRSVADKRLVLREALRVVKPGGRFAFVDYFAEAKYYGSPSEFKTYLTSLNLAQCTYQPLREALPLPLFLRHPKIFGRVGVVYGKK